MKIFEIHRGNTRIVFLLFPLNIALKFPRFDFLLGLKMLFKIGSIYLRSLFSNDDKIKNDLNWHIKWVLKGHYERTGFKCISYLLFRGIMANRNEFTYSSIKPRNSLLIPTFFSLFGLINIQPIVKPMKNFSVGLYHKLCNIVDDIKELRNSDGHAFEDGNFTKRKDGSIVLYDYGSSRAWPIIQKYGDRLTNILKTT